MKKKKEIKIGDKVTFRINDEIKKGEVIIVAANKETVFIKYDINERDIINVTDIISVK
jgi:hypothetical protein